MVIYIIYITLSIYVFSIMLNFVLNASKIVKEYDQEITQSQNADKPMAPRGRATQ